ncbi:MAG: type II secretion system protein GspN [Proteobacteria bacterium]|nr:type II secretion system protein GspN [Pseudomonadota bacterium]
MKKAAFFIAVVFFVFWGLWIIAIPNKFVSDYISNSLKRYNIIIDLDSFEKGLFYSIKKQNVQISSTDGTLILVINNLKAGINFASFLKLSPKIDIHCNINKGDVDGNIGFKKGTGLVARIKGSGIDIKDLPVVEKLYGISGTGDINFDFLKIKDKSNIKFSLNNADIKSIGLIPFDLFKKMRGEMFEENGLITVKSLAMEGNGIYARAKGYIKGNKRDLKMEIMVNSSSDMKPSYLEALEKYRVSPGYYVIR